MWYFYTINTFDKDEPIQLNGCLEAESENEAIIMIKKLYTGMGIGYEFLELLERDRYWHPTWVRNCISNNSVKDLEVNNNKRSNREYD